MNPLAAIPAGHEGLVETALAALSEADGDRHIAELRAFLRSLRVDAGTNVVLELRREAWRRKDAGDSTWRAWMAWAESRSMLDTLRDLWEAS